MNTIPAIHLDQWVEEGGAGAPGEFHQQSDWKPRSDTGDTSSFGSPKDEWVSCRGSGEGAGGLCDRCSLQHGNGSLVPLLFAYWARDPEARSQGSNPACTSLLNFSPISITLGWSMRSSSSTTKRAWGDDLLISVWFLHPTLIEIHTASLAWLSLA